METFNKTQNAWNWKGYIMQNIHINYTIDKEMLGNGYLTETDYWIN